MSHIFKISYPRSRQVKQNKLPIDVLIHMFILHIDIVK